ncbi:MAG: hypothetical protein ACM3S2_05105 [Ignavibacteriales bacterium]
MRKLLFILVLLLSTFLSKNDLFAEINPFVETTPVIEFYLEGAIVSQITGDKDDIWVATYGKGIFHYSAKDNSWTNYSTAKGNLQQDFFYCIAVDKDHVWAGCSDGLFTLDKKSNTWMKRKFGKGGELGQWVRAVAYDKYLDVLWIGRFKFLTKLEISKQKYTDYDLTLNNDAKTNNIKTIKVDGDSLVWFGTEVGIHKYRKNRDIEDKSAVQFITNKDHYFNGEGDVVSPADILFESKNIWFGLDEFITVQRPNFNIGGVYFYDRRLEWERFGKSNGLPANGVFCLARTGNYIWASVYEFNKNNKEQVGQGIALINRVTKSIKKITKDELKLHSDKITSMFFDNDNMWLGTEAGLLKIKITNDFAFLKK